jgi:hypothetical protein
MRAARLDYHRRPPYSEGDRCWNANACDPGATFVATTGNAVTQLITAPPSLSARVAALLILGVDLSPSKAAGPDRRRVRCRIGEHRCEAR